VVQTGYDAIQCDTRIFDCVQKLTGGQLLSLVYSQRQNIELIKEETETIKFD